MAPDTEAPGGEAVPDQAQDLQSIDAGKPSTSNGSTTRLQKRLSAFNYLEPIPWSRLNELPRQAWLIKYVLGVGTLSAIVGASGSGKTFVAIDIAAHIARGIDWCGRKVTQGAVLYIAAEGGRGIIERFNAYAKRYNIDTKDVPLYVLPQSVDLRSPTIDMPDLINIINSYKYEFALIIVDTLNCAMAGGDENAPADMGMLLVNCRRILSETGAHVMLLHHLGKDSRKGARGHSSLRAALDTEITAQINGHITLMLSKERDGRSGDRFGFELKEVELEHDEDNEAINSCVVVSLNVKDARLVHDQIKKSVKLTTAEHAALSALRAQLDTSGVPADGSLTMPVGSLVVAIKAWRKRCYEASISGSEDARARQQAFKRAMEGLKGKHQVIIAGDYVCVAEEATR